MWDWDREAGGHMGYYGAPSRQESENPQPKEICSCQLILKETYHRQGLKYSHFSREDTTDLTADSEGT